VELPFESVLHQRFVQHLESGSVGPRTIGIEKGKPFNPDEKAKALLSEAARIGGAIARANTW
jgi:hypothetical protein